MKKLLLVALAAVVVAGASVLVVGHYHDYKNKKTQQPAVQMVPASDLQALQTTTSKELKDLQDDNGRLLAECQKGAAAYAKLSPLVKNQTSAPQCGPAVVK